MNTIKRERDFRWENWFVMSVGCILALTGCAKLWSAFGQMKVLAIPDPVIGISYRNLLFGVGLLEVLIGWFCFMGRQRKLALGLTAWLATAFVIYRLSLIWLDYHKPCNCLGTLTDALHISPNAADTVMKVILAYLLVGSYGILIWQWVRSRRLAVHDPLPSSL